MYKKKPFFIVFEGVEGCGKSFQSKKLFNKLKRKKLTQYLQENQVVQKFRINKKFNFKRLFCER